MIWIWNVQLSRNNWTDLVFLFKPIIELGMFDQLTVYGLLMTMEIFIHVQLIGGQPNKVVKFFARQFSTKKSFCCDTHDTWHGWGYFSILWPNEKREPETNPRSNPWIAMTNVIMCWWSSILIHSWEKANFCQEYEWQNRYRKKVVKCWILFWSVVVSLKIVDTLTARLCFIIWSFSDVQMFSNTQSMF